MERSRKPCPFGLLGSNPSVGVFHFNKIFLKMKERKIRLTKKERDIIKKLNTPRKIQDYINNNIKYDFDNDSIVRSFRMVLKDRRANCLDGAIFSASVLYFYGKKPLIVCMEARDMDHNIAVYKENGKWGSIAQSRDQNLKEREPRFNSIKDLVMSYYPYYWDCFSDPEDITNLTLRGYSLVNLERFMPEFIVSEESLNHIEDFLWQTRYRFLFPRHDMKKFYRIDKKTEKLFFEEH
ncbi:MAG: hypothetical protein KatS3mg001_009 [Candidatus Pacearchaeota archaeon]|nr:MAG: hypothetical protein KatS3mg001_009 [Candidatus Pacearchaeota archaeon]